MKRILAGEPMALVLLDIDPRGVATATLNRPEVGNAYNEELLAELIAGLERLGPEPAVRCLVCAVRASTSRPAPMSPGSAGATHIPPSRTMPRPWPPHGPYGSGRKAHRDIGSNLPWGAGGDCGDQALVPWCQRILGERALNEPSGLMRAGPSDMRPRGMRARLGTGRRSERVCKVALSSGGDSGIGRAVGIGFAKEGADVALTYLDEHEDAQETVCLIEAEGRRALAIPGDIGNSDFARPGRSQVRTHRHTGE
jgi:hypothetical protein